jgi:DNA-binding FadR family transcriptional regulator
MQRGFAAALGAWRTKEGPLARSLSAAVREAVVDGRLPAGTRLPSERELARTLDLSRGTVVTALTGFTAKETYTVGDDRWPGQVPARLV